MSSTDYRIEWRDGYAVFTLSRPDKLNGITNAVLQGLADCLDEIERRRFRGLVIAGEGRAFSAGTDLEESATLTLEQGFEKCDRARALMHRLHRSTITSVAAVHGIAYGGGMELALACTLRVAGPATKLALPEVKLAVLPAYGGTQLLPALIGRARAADLMLTGRSVKAEEALQLGLVSRLVAETGDELPAAIALVEQVTGYSQLAIERIHYCLHAAGDDLSSEGLELERQAMRELITSDDAAEGLSAFLEKRKPNFQHR